MAKKTGTKTPRRFAPRPSEQVIRGIRALARPEVSAALVRIVAGESIASVATPNGMATAEEIKGAQAALAYVGQWEKWRATDLREKLTAKRKQTAALRSALDAIAGTRGAS